MICKLCFCSVFGCLDVLVEQIGRDLGQEKSWLFRDKRNFASGLPQTLEGVKEDEQDHWLCIERAPIVDTELLSECLVVDLIHVPTLNQHAESLSMFLNIDDLSDLADTVNRDLILSPIEEEWKEFFRARDVWHTDKRVEKKLDRCTFPLIEGLFSAKCGDRITHGLLRDWWQGFVQFLWRAL